MCDPTLSIRQRLLLGSRHGDLLTGLSFIHTITSHNWDLVVDRRRYNLRYAPGICFVAHLLVALVLFLLYGEQGRPDCPLLLMSPFEPTS